MMSKRFVMGGDTHIIDTKTNEEYYAPCETELLDLLNELHEENKKLRQERERWIEKTDKLEQYIDSLFWGNTHICKHLDIEMVKFWCDKKQKYHMPHCTYEDCFKKENLVKTADEVLRSVDDE